MLASYTVFWEFGSVEGRSLICMESKSATNFEELDDFVDFMWTEGNYSCDCNRSRMFGFDEELPCGDSIKVIKIERIAEGLK